VVGLKAKVVELEARSCQLEADKVKAETFKAFLRYMLTDGQKAAPSIDYAPLSASLVEKALAQLDKIKLPV